MSDNHRPRVERPRVEPEIIPPQARAHQRGFDSMFVRVEEGDLAQDLGLPCLGRDDGRGQHGGVRGRGGARVDQVVR